MHIKLKIDISTRRYELYIIKDKEMIFYYDVEKIFFTSYVYHKKKVIIGV